MNRAKFKALVHYVIAKCDPSRLGAVRLNKVLWYADTFAYRATGESMTGEAYVKRQRGPVPQHILGVLEELKEDGAIVIRERARFDFSIREFIMLRSPDTSFLSQEEMDVVDEMREHICDLHTANSISDLSHDQVWEAANMGEIIPMWATLAASPGAITPEVIAWADAVIENAQEALAA